MNTLIKFTSKLIIFLPVWILAANFKAVAQQPFIYNQYMDNLTPINPAYSLLQKEGAINTLVRKQWVGVPGSPTSYFVNGSVPISSIDASAGIMASNDIVAIEHLAEFNAFFAKSVSLGEGTGLGVSINAGIRNYVAKYSEVDSSDPAFANDIRQTQPNVGFGVIYYTNFYYIGLSVPEFNIRDLGAASQQDNSNLRNHYYLSAGITTSLNDDFTFKYAALASYSRSTPVAAAVSGMVVLKETFGIGANYQTNNEVAGMLSVTFNKFHLGYSYQFGTTSANIGGLHNGTNELTLGLRFGKKADQN